MTIKINITDSNAKDTMLGLSYDAWGVIGSVLIPMIIFIIGYVINHQIKKINRKDDLIEQVNLIISIGRSKIQSLTDQVSSLDQFCNSIRNLKTTTNETLTLHLFDYNDLDNLNFPQITNSYMIYVKGNPTENFKLVNSYYTNFIHTSKLYDKMTEYMDDYYNDLVYVRKNWNDLTNQINDTMRLINNSQGLDDLKLEFQRLVNLPDNNIPNFIMNRVDPLVDFFMDKYARVGSLSPIELELHSYFIRIKQIYNDFEAIKTKYFGYYDWLRSEIDSNRQKFQTTIDHLTVASYLANHQIYFGKTKKLKN